MDVQEARDSNGEPSESDNQQKYSCTLCPKSFPQASSRNRHVLYCRQRSKMVQLPRRRSCVSCRRAKTRCDLGNPSCWSCIRKGADCVFETNIISAPLATRKTNESTALEHRRSSSTIVSPGDAETGMDRTDSRIRNQTQSSMHQDFLMPMILTSTATPLLEDFLDDDTNLNADDEAPSEAPSILWQEGPSPEQQPLNINFDVDLPMEFMMNEGCTTGIFELPRYHYTSDSGSSFSATTFDMISNPSPVPPGFRNEFLTIAPNMPAARVNLFRQNTKTFSSKLGYNFLLSNLRTYPTIMLDPSRLPPFFHSQLAKSDNETEALAICKSIINLHSTKTKQNSPFIWRTVDMEQKRLHNEHDSFDEWNVVASLQAVTVYILLHIFEEDTMPFGLDMKLIQTMTALAHNTEASGFLCNSEILGEVPSWKEWILVESKRRTIMLLFILHLMFDISPHQTSKALSGLAALPVPASKALWQACSESQWTEEYQKFLGRRKGCSALTYGDILKLHGNGGMGKDPRMTNLNEWYTDIDEFGILVLLTATSLEL